MADDYRLIAGAPSIADYVRLRREAGLTSRSDEQAQLAIAGGWAACHVVCKPSGEAVAMGRLIGDGRWYRIRATAPPGAFVSLMADPPARSLYARHGFTEDREASIGMARWL